MARAKFIMIRMLPLVVGVILLYLFLNKAADWAQFKNALLGVNIPYLLLATLFCTFTIIVSTCRWQILMRVFGTVPRFGRLLRLVLESTFFNLVIPGGIAGDVARTLNTRSELMLSKAASAVLTDRLMGLLGFVALSFVSLTILWSELRAHSLAIPTLGAGAVFVVAMALIYSRRLMYILSQWVKNIPILGQALTNLTSALNFYRSNMSVLFGAFAVTLVSHSLQILSTWCVVLSLGQDIAFLPVALTVPIVALLASIPITHFGIGLREGGFVVLFGLFGISATPAILVSVLFSLIAIVLPALVGLLLLMLKMIGEFRVRGMPTNGV